MPKKIKLNRYINPDNFRDKFVDAYKAKDAFGNVHTIPELARIFGFCESKVKDFANQYGLSRNKRRNNND